MKTAIELSEKTGVKVLFCLDVPGPKMARRARELEALGAEYVIVHHHSEELAKISDMHSYDYVGEVAEAVNILVGASCDNLEEAIQAVKDGASFVVFGAVLRELNYDTCKKWVDAIHSAR